MDNYIIIENVLGSFELVRQELDNKCYLGEVNPVDNVFYEGVNKDVPNYIYNEVVNKIEGVLASSINVNAMFFRMSKKGVFCPHQAHTDSTMGKYSFMLYLNRLDDCIGGTSFLRHNEIGLESDPINKKQLDIWDRDKNNPDKWHIISMVQMIPNLGVIFNSNEMHRAEPIGGFGTTNQDSRLVLTAFFDI